MTRVKNPLLARLLTWASRTTDTPRWLPIHEVVRRADLSFFPPVVSLILKRATSLQSLRVLARNSVQTPGSFNCFRSDVDFSVIFEEEPTGDEVFALVRGYGKLARLLPFLGEMETYTRIDWARKSELQEKFFPLVDLISQLRKWQAELRALSSAQTPYQEFKARNAITRIRIKLGLSPTPAPGEDIHEILNRVIETRLEKLLPRDLLAQGRLPTPVQGRSDYLEWDLKVSNLCFVALLPDGDWGFETQGELIQKLRQNHLIREILGAISEMELLTLKHHQRVSGSSVKLVWHKRLVRFSQLNMQVNPPGRVIWFTGLPCSGKSTLASAVCEVLKARGMAMEYLDGDAVRKLEPHLGFSRKDRDEHIKRIGERACRLEADGVFVVASFVSPYRDTRNFVRQMCSNFFEVHVSTPLAECEKRDTKGLYAKARKGEIPNFTGVNDPYEEPLTPELRIDTASQSIEEGLKLILAAIKVY